MAFLWSLVVIDPLIVLSTILCGCVSIVLTLFDKSGNTAILVGRFWARSLLLFVGVRVRVEGLEKIRADGKYVFCSNHLSYMDTPVVLSHIPVQFRFLAKRGLFQIPFMGTHLKQAGHIPVPLEDARAAVKTLTLGRDDSEAFGFPADFSGRRAIGRRCPSGFQGGRGLCRHQSARTGCAHGASGDA